MIKFFDLFAGISGFRSGLQAVGDADSDFAMGAASDMGATSDMGAASAFKCIGFCEKDKYAVGAYRALYDTENEVFFNDATTINTAELPRFNLLVAGFPCQSFSVAGLRRGFEDVRGTLFFEIARILKDKRPEFFCLENVPGLLSHLSGQTCQKILETLSELGYSFEWHVCNSAAFGVPQQRKRLYIVGYTKPECAGKIFPLREGNAENIKQIVGGAQGERIYGADGVAITQTASCGGFSGKTGLYFIDLNPDPKLTETARCITARYDAGVSGSHKGERSGVLCEEGARAVINPDRDNIWQCGRRIKEPDEPMFTITVCDRHGIYHNGRIRKLMPEECWRLQGFTAEQFNKAAALGLSDNQLYKLAGNAVTVNVITAIGEKIKALWDEYYNDENEESI